MGSERTDKKQHPMGATEKALIPACGARTRAGGACRQYAMVNGRCGWHGGKSLSGVASGTYKHGWHTKEMKAYRKEIRALLRQAREMW